MAKSYLKKAIKTNRITSLFKMLVFVGILSLSLWTVQQNTSISEKAATIDFTANIPMKRAIVAVGQSNMNGTIPYIRQNLPNYEILDCAIGGTSILEWQPGKPHYDNCLEKTKSLQNQGYIISAIFFYQGEADSHNETDARRWKLYLNRFLNNFLKDIESPDIPFIYAQLANVPNNFSYTKGWNIIKNLQRIFETERDNAKMIYTSDIEPHCPEGEVHYCPEGYKKLGWLFSNTFKNYKK